MRSSRKGRSISSAEEPVVPSRAKAQEARTSLRSREERQQPRRDVLLGLLLDGNVPVLGAAEALLEVARRRDRVRGVAAGNDQRRQIEAQQVLRLGAGGGVAIEQGARGDGEQQPVRLRIERRIRL